ncbi:TRAP transporter substrate-binding protein [Szabonella alba]|uniref:TRAP transporter substrate-binding protein n=1 Tax=Szabonella alba TaxID=2804194 RepID=A0A8K0VBJ6_9RHOB|nr:TRAP transporter substrate-binding protein [Szabonella alba]MBL4916739.1 TRAP transporter substrate-binding protein [Szabonella alba]
MATFGSTIALAMTVGASVALGTSGAVAQDSITLNAAHVGTVPDHHFNYGFESFARHLAELSGDRFETIIHQGTMGGQRENVEQVQEGILDITSTSLSLLGNFGGQAGVFDLPYLFASREEAYRALDSDVGQQVVQDLRNNNLILLSYWENGFRHITNNAKPIQTPEDIAGLRIRVPESPEYVATFEALGARPTPMSWTEVFTGLQQGVIDGQENPFGNTWDGNMFEVQKFMSMTGHVYAGNGVVMNLARFEALTEEEQGWVMEAARLAQGEQRQYVQDMDVEFKSRLEEKGMQINEVADKGPFIEAAEGAYEAVFYDKYGRELIDQIRAVARSE